jgi:hypothetical protein
VKDLKQNGIVAIKAKIYAQERRHLWKLKGASNTMRVCVCVCMRMRVCACVCVGAVLGWNPGLHTCWASTLPLSQTPSPSSANFNTV